MKKKATINNKNIMSQRKKIYINDEIYIYFLLFIIPFLFFCPVLFSNVSICAGDGVGYEIALRFFKQACSEGEFPLWNKYVALGTSFVGDIQNRVFYPLTWFCAFLPADIAFKFFYVLHISMANLFMYGLCKEIECGRIVSFCGTFFFSFSNLIIIRYEHINILCCLVWIPLIFTLLIKYYRSMQKKYIAVTALVMGIQFMAGFPQTAFYSDLFVFISMFYLNYRFNNSIRKYLVDSFKLGTLYIGICFVQMLPLVEIMRFSGRNEISFEYFSDGAANLLQVLNLFTPIATGYFGNLLPGSHEFPNDTYLGMIPVTLIIFVVVYMHNNKDVRFLFGYAMFALIFASACSNIPVLGKLIYLTPVFGSFRTTTRMLAFFVIPMIFLSIIGLKEIVINKLWKQYFNITAYTLTFLVMVYIAVRSFGGNTQNAVIAFWYENDVGLKSIVLLIIVNIAIILYLRQILLKRINMIFAMFIALFQIFDVYFYNTDKSADIWKMSNLINARTYEEIFESDVKSALQEANADGRERYFESFYTWQELENTSWSIRPNGNVLAKLPMIQSYITFNNPALLSLTNTTYGMMMNADELKVSSNQSLMSFLNIGYIVSRVSQQPLGEYESRGILFEEYEGREYEDSENVLLGSVNADSYISISIDAEVVGEGSILSLYEGEEKILNIGELIQGGQFYNYCYAPQMNTNSLRLVFETGSNVKINGIRIECFKLSSLSSLDVLYSNEEYRIYKNHENAGHIFVFENVNAIDDVENYIVDNKETIDFVKDAYLNKEVNDISLVNCAGNILSSIETNNTLSAKVKINSEQALLGFSESFYPGWKVYVDNEKQDLIQVDGLIQGVMLTKGEHEVEFKYEPLSVYVGGSVSLGTIALIVIYVFVADKKGKENEYYKKSTNA